MNHQEHQAQAQTGTRQDLSMVEPMGLDSASYKQNF